MATSTDSRNFTLANSLTSDMASSTAYCLPGVSFSRAARMRLLILAFMSQALHVDAHAAGAAGDGTHRGFQIRGGDVRHLDLGDLLQLLARDLAHLVGVGRGAALVDADSLANQHRGRRRLGDEGEAAVVVDRDHHRDRQALLELLSLGVERLAELHDVDALLAERRSHGRGWIRLAGRNLQLHVRLYLLRHVLSSRVLTPDR